MDWRRLWGSEDSDGGRNGEGAAGMVNFRLPGPTPLPPAVVEAMRREMIPHRGPVFRAFYADLLRRAREVHRTEGAVFIWPASGSAGWEVAIVNLLSPGDRVVAAVCGDFGDRFAKAGLALGLDVRRLDVPWGEAVTAAALAQALEMHDPVQAVFLTHNETSTGVTNPLRDLTQVAVEHNALTIVDAVSSAGALPLEMDAWHVDFVLSGSQKAWMCPPGLLIAGVGGRAWDAYARSTFPRFFWDIGAARASAANGLTPATPPLTLLYAFDAALRLIEEEGLEQVWARHRALGHLTRTGLTEIGLELFANPAYASDTVTAFRPPAGMTAAALLDVMRRDHGIELQNGQAHLADAIVRIGHMGWAHEPELLEVLTALRTAVDAQMEPASPAALTAAR